MNFVQEQLIKFKKKTANAQNFKNRCWKKVDLYIITISNTLLINKLKSEQKSRNMVEEGQSSLVWAN